jgi:large subunit ribosomal protein L35e
LGKIKIVRKSIARVLTVYNQKQRGTVAEHLAKTHAKRLPLDLRAKKTRAIRREMTVAQKTKKTLKAQKKAAYFPLRKFAVKA